MCFKLSPSESNNSFKTLSALLFVFILSWTPYNLLLIIRVLMEMEPGQRDMVRILQHYAFTVKTIGLLDTIYLLYEAKK